jgi:hypothetical protein
LRDRTKLIAKFFRIQDYEQHVSEELSEYPSEITARSSMPHIPPAVEIARRYAITLPLCTFFYHSEFLLFQYRQRPTINGDIQYRVYEETDEKHDR